jgi:hypothetical protein
LKIKNFSDYYNNCPKLIGYALIVSSILLFAPYMFTVMLSSFVAIMQPEDLSVLLYLTLLGESFVLQYISTVPATILLILGIVKLKK